MKTIFKSLFFLCCSFSFCLAEPFEDFKQDFASNITTLRALSHKIDTLEESRHEEYFGKNPPIGSRLDKIKKLFELNLSITEKHQNFTMAIRKKTVSSSDLGALSFTCYCRTLPLLKNLHDEKQLAHSDSSYNADLEESINALNFYANYFSWEQNILCDYIKIVPIGRRESLKWYAVNINERDIFLSMRRLSRSVMNRLSLFDLEKFVLPPEYKMLLENKIGYIKK